MKLISLFVLTGLSGLTLSQAHVNISEGGLTLVEEGGTFDTGNLSTIAGSVAFTNGDLGDTIPSITYHEDFNLNDGTYGNSASWIGDPTQPPAPNTAPSFGGITFSTPQNVQSFAFGRDNLGGFFARTYGIYTLQWTSSVSPDSLTTDTGDASTGWATIGTLNYVTSAPATSFSAPSLRHRYNFTEVIGATALRLITPDGAAIDELEFYAAAAPVPAALVTTAATGFTLGWDGNDGANFDSSVPANLALSGTAIGSGELGGSHSIAHANDGLYGNTNSWIGAAAPGQFIGIDLGGLHDVTSFAFGRDNGNLLEAACGGQCQDRSIGDYGIEFTVNGVDWIPLGTVSSLDFRDTAVGGGFTEYLRHEFDIGLDGGGAVQMSGLRIQVSDPSIAIDELEIFGTPVPEPSTGLSLLLAMSLILFRSRRRR